MAIEFEKYNDTCSNVYLIDERLCLKDSYEIFNKNVASLSSNLNVLQNYGNGFNYLYSIFSVNSSRWMKAISNFQTLSADWFSAETTVKALSSYWSSDHNIIYNKIIDLNTYTSNEILYNTYIKNWLTINFKSNLIDNQIINVDLYLSNIENFTWSYAKSYYESCEPTRQSNDNVGCACKKPQDWCNHVALNNKEVYTKTKVCVDAMQYCTEDKITITGGGTPPRCPARTPDTINLVYNNPQTDKSLVRVITLKYKKLDNNTIIKL
jgi:hypothetical protein